MKIHEELKIYRDYLIALHQARWLVDVKRWDKYLDALSAYSRARTKSLSDAIDAERRENSLIGLRDVINE